MTLNELQLLHANRKEGESVNETQKRLLQERKPVALLPPPQEEPGTEEPLPNDEDFAETSLVIPRYKIIQPTTRLEGATTGRYLNTLTGEEKEKLENIVFLKRTTGRVLFPKDDYSGERACWSYDGLFPAAQEILFKSGQPPQHSQCVSKSGGVKTIHCPMAEWHKDEKNNNIAPLCKETIGFLGIEQGDFPFMIIFHGKAIPTIKTLLASIYLKTKQALLQGKTLYLRDFFVTLGLKLQINEKGKFYMPVIEKIEEINNAAERKLFTDCFHAFERKNSIEPQEAQTATA